jgi:hypothetical protein
MGVLLGVLHFTHSPCGGIVSQFRVPRKSGRFGVEWA